MIKQCVLKYDKNRFPKCVCEKKIEYGMETQVYNNPKIIYELVKCIFDCNNLPEEYAWLVTLNNALKIQAIFEIAHGTCNTALLDTKNIFARALVSGANNIILIHNHPSGLLNPSQEDLDITEKIAAAGKILGINLIDHIIVGNDGCGYISLQTLGLM